MALLLIAAAWARSAGRRLLAITIDHGLNPESPVWNRRCEAAAREVGADWVARRWDGDKPATGQPAAARRARHALIAEVAREAGAKVILFAHTADDIAEADWMRARGSTLGSLRDWSPSPAWPEGRGLMLLRPMLAERREALREWLRETGRDWIEDPGNTGFSRGRARSALSPAAVGQGLPPGESEVIGLAREGKGQTEAGEECPSSVRLTDRCAVRDSSSVMLGGGFRVARSINAKRLSATLLCASGQSRLPRHDRLAALAARLTAAEDFAATLAGGRIEAVGDQALISREPGEMLRRPCADVPLHPGVPAVWDGRYELTADQPGWTVTSAAGRLNALSRADRNIIDTVPGWARGALPILIRDGSAAPVLAWREARTITSRAAPSEPRDGRNDA